MLIRDAVQRVASARFSETRTVILLSSFEPLHLATYLQALLVERYPEGSPRVVRFGYDQLQEGLARTTVELKGSPALLCLSWEDIHPGLTWRSRGPFGDLHDDEIIRQGRALGERLADWLGRRALAETYLALPSRDWLPHHDACPSAALGPSSLAAVAVLQEIAHRLAGLGGRVLRLPPMDLHYRELLHSGCPLSIEGSELVARRFVEAACPSSARKKAIVTDLDGTLWWGVIGEDGPEGILCRPEGKGYPYHVFQKFLGKLKREGVWLAFCSKNNPSDVVPVFDALEIPLRLKDFAAYRCNWEPKPANIRSIAEELNIGWEDLVVVDDNPAELAEIRSRLPGLATFETPRDGQAWKRLLADLQAACGTWRVSEEDRLRTTASAGARPRGQAVDEPGASSWTDAPAALEHLRDMRLEITVNHDALADPRSLELINKTNQFNLTGERFLNEGWTLWAETPGVFCLSARLRDRFGDFGTICVMTGRAVDEATVQLRQFVLSCRAFSRGVEAVVLGELVHLGAWEWLCGRYTPTGKNEPARRFLAQLGCPIDACGEWQVSRQAVEALAAKAIRDTAVSIRVADAPAGEERMAERAASALREGGEP